MKYLIKITVAILFVFNIAQAQESTKKAKGFFNITEVGFFYGGNDRRVQIGPKAFQSTFDEAKVYSLRNISGWFLNQHLSFGLGVGADGIQIKPSPFYNTFLLFVDGRYYFNEEDESFFTYSDIGSAVAIDQSFQKGLMWNIGGGYKFMVAEKTVITASLGYNEQYIKTTTTDKQRIPSVAFKVGIMF